MRNYREIIRLTWPLALGMANNALMQFADRVFLAHDSAASLEAVLPAAMLAITFICFFQSAVAYSGSFVAQFFGAGDRLGCVRSRRAGVFASFVSAVVLAALIPAGHVALDAAGHSPAVLAREKTYFDVTMAGSFFLCATMAAQGYFTGIGRTRCVFWVNLTGNAANVAFDYAFIFGFGPIPALGIGGAAAATVMAQALQCAALTWMARRHERGFLAGARGPSFRSVVALIPRMLRFAAPSGMHQLVNLLSFTVFVFATAAAGDVALAVSNAVFTVNYLLFAPLEGFAVGAGVLVGQRQGAGDSQGALVAGNRTLAVALAYVALSCAVMWIFRRPILALFAADSSAFDPDEFVSLGGTLLALAVSWQIFDAVDTVVSGALKGAGDTRFVMTWMIVAALAFWMPLVFAVRALHPTMPAFWATSVAYMAFICVGTVWRWLRGPWRKIKMV